MPRTCTTRRQQRHQQRRIGRVEDEPAAEQPHVGSPAARAVADFARHGRRHLRVEALKSHRLEARHGETRRRRQEHEVARLECQRTVAIDGQTTTALEHGAEARLAEGRVADTPAAGAADPPREHGTRLKQRDDFRERVVHGWTLTNEIRTPRCRSPRRGGHSSRRLRLRSTRR